MPEIQKMRIVLFSVRLYLYHWKEHVKLSRKNLILKFRTIVFRPKNLENFEGVP